MSRARELAALGGILALAAGLRFAALDRQGLLFFDEGQLILEARQMHGLIAARGRMAGAPAERRAAARLDLADAVRGCRIVFGKPGHNLLLAAALAVEPDARRATLALSGLAGTLTVLALWIATRRWYGAAAGLSAALLLAVSPYHLMYSREGLSDALTLLGFTLALAVPPGRGPGRAALSGVFAGSAVTTNYRDLFLPAVFAWIAWRGAGAAAASRPRAGAVRILAWGAGFALPLVACEGLYRALAATAGADFPAGTYVGQLRELLAYHGGQGFRWAGWAAFPAHLLRWDGPVALASLVVTLGWQLRRWRDADADVNPLLLVPWVLFSAYWDNAPRFFAILLPVTAAIQGRWLTHGGAMLARRRGWPVALCAAPVVIVALVSLTRSAAMVPRVTPYHEAARRLAAGGDPRHLSTNPRLGDAYFGPGAAMTLPATAADLATASGAGWRWAVIDVQRWFGGFDRPTERLAVADRITARGRPVLDTGYDPQALEAYVLEQDLPYRDAVVMLDRVRALSPRLTVWDLRAVR